MKPHWIYFLGTLLLLCAAGIWAVMNRYEIRAAGPLAYQMDRWTGKSWVLTPNRKSEIFTEQEKNAVLWNDEKTNSPGSFTLEEALRGRPSGR